ncbi:glycerophosphodiester phosphodiesterase family protein [Enterococcus timonensis]|uniref:glycerophosphodiester phosphodiesterase family protein n=1 Tax=Enterococcus timonensis TaxID=1852364 RepID=UPI0008DAEB3A|nr:glycerophosphodiester phosphodiesterase family protein [Enterococcus timonensis]
MEIFAHRGSSAHFPENTKESFADALNYADGLELDVHVSSDQQLVVIHDESVDRTSDGKGLVRKMTLSQLQQLNIGSTNHPSTIMTLPEVLHFLQQKKFTGTLNIEAKTNKFAYPTLVPLLVEALNKQDWSFSILISSFNLETLLAIHEEKPALSLALLASHNQRKIAKVLKYPFITSLHPDFLWVQRQASEIALFPKLIRPWTVNTKKDLLYAKHLGLSAIITDYPKEAREAIWKGRL